MTTCCRPLSIILTIAILVSPTANATAGNKPTRDKSGEKSSPVANAVSAEVDALILADLEKAGVKPVGQCNDEDFLRRVSLDITGQLPSPRDVTLFVLNPDPAKRTTLIDKLIASPEFGKNWARYWRDVIYMAATDPRSRINQSEFETWMAEQWNKGTGWNETTTAMLTALGDVNEHPETALIFAHAAETEDVAAEACRIFLGIQMQCANCHDHPSDIWKREQFHELAAYFPRMSRRQTMTSAPTPTPGQTQPPRQPQAMRFEFEIASVNTDRNRGDFMRDNPEQWLAMLDRNRDGKVSKQELKGGPGMMRGQGMPNQLLDRLFELGDTNKDDALTLAEVKAMPQPGNQRRGSTEHHMPDLKDPSSKGKLVQPKFFIDGSSPGQGLSDLERRSAAAKAFTSPDNPWFARAIVNRVWCEMLGEGFYMPVDDLGPTRSARFPEALEAICKGFVANAYDPKWLIRTVANSQTYQRKVAAKSTAEDALPFASVTPTRLRADVVFNSLLQVVGIDEESIMSGRPGMMMAGGGGGRALQRLPRFGFDSVFGVDPSTPKEDITGNVPQALVLMNSPYWQNSIRSSGNSRLARILRDNKDDTDALSEVFLATLAREPSRHEVELCQNYIKEVGQRGEAFEDLMWSLLNSSEFLSKR